jgi:hypothetical protein
VISVVLGLYVLAFSWIVLSYLLFVIFGKVHFTAVIMSIFFGTNKNQIFLRIFLAYLVGYFCRIISTDNP